MQTVVQVISGKAESLRDRIVNDKRLERFGLEVAEYKRQTRPHGWAKIHMPGELGAINIEWHGTSQMLICRVVTRGGPPNPIAGAFVNYLLVRHRKRIQSIQIIPVKLRRAFGANQ